jgi:hypothetical protein
MKRKTIFQRFFVHFYSCYKNTKQIQNDLNTHLVDDEATAAHGPHEGGGHFLFLVGNLGPGTSAITSYNNVHFLFMTFL